jgi:hypothetical protein
MFKRQNNLLQKYINRKREKKDDNEEDDNEEDEDHVEDEDFKTCGICFSTKPNDYFIVKECCSANYCIKCINEYCDKSNGQCPHCRDDLPYCKQRRAQKERERLASLDNSFKFKSARKTNRKSRKAKKAKSKRKSRKTKDKRKSIRTKKC